MTAVLFGSIIYILKCSTIFIVSSSFLFSFSLHSLKRTSTHIRTSEHKGKYAIGASANMHNFGHIYSNSH